MAYSDYGAFVWLNGERRKDKEDVAMFATDEETFGTESKNIPSGARIWANLLWQKENNTNIHIHHGILGDGNIRVVCHKQGRPKIVEATEDGIKEIKYCDDDTDCFDYRISFKYKGYEFYFVSGEPYYVEMMTPTGDVWECNYDYEYGAGFEEDES